jgi:hypothetical protein
MSVSYLLPAALSKLVIRFRVSLPSRLFFFCLLNCEISVLTRTQQWMAAGATVVSIKWAVPQLQEHEACKGFYVYTAAAAAGIMQEQSSSGPHPASAEHCSTSAEHCSTSAEHCSVEDFFCALEV